MLLWRVADLLHDGSAPTGSPAPGVSHRFRGRPLVWPPGFRRL